MTFPLVFDHQTVSWRHPVMCEAGLGPSSRTQLTLAPSTLTLWPVLQPLPTIHAGPWLGTVPGRPQPPPARRSPQTAATVERRRHCRRAADGRCCRCRRCCWPVSSRGASSRCLRRCPRRCLRRWPRRCCGSRRVPPPQHASQLPPRPRQQLLRRRQVRVHGQEAHAAAAFQQRKRRQGRQKSECRRPCKVTHQLGGWGARPPVRHLHEH